MLGGSLGRPYWGLPENSNSIVYRYIIYLLVPVQNQAQTVMNIEVRDRTPGPVQCGMTGLCLGNQYTKSDLLSRVHILVTGYLGTYHM
jgi:hypothetical protein